MGRADGAAKAQELQLAALGRTALDAELQPTLASAHNRWPGEVEHHPALSDLIGRAHLHQLGDGQLQPQFRTLFDGLDPQGLEQGSPVDGDFVVEADLRARPHGQGLAKPFQIKAAIGAAAAAHPQLTLQNFKGEPELLRPPATPTNPAPAGRLGLTIDPEAGALDDLACRAGLACGAGLPCGVWLGGAGWRRWRRWKCLGLAADYNNSRHNPGDQPADQPGAACRPQWADLSAGVLWAILGQR